MSKKDKPFPYNQDAEQSVLGAALQNEYAADEAVAMLSEKDFYNKIHEEIFSVIKELNKDGMPIDLITVSDALKRKGLLDLVGGPLYLSELISAVPAPTNIRYYADIVQEHEKWRSLMDVSESIIEKCTSGVNPREVLEYAEQKILDIGRAEQKDDFTPAKEVVEESIANIEKLSKLKPGEMTGLMTGFTELDRITNGLQPSDLIVLAARPGIGKTSLALNIALNAAIKKDAIVIIFSLEMSRISLGQRLLSTHGNINLERIRNGQIIKDSKGITKLGEAASAIADTKIFINDTPGIQINEVKNKCRRLKSKMGLDLVIIDYLQLMEVGADVRESSKVGSREREIAALTRSLKLLARELDCPVVVLSQLSRAMETNRRHKPILSDLRESGAIEQDADIVMFIYQDKEDEGSLEFETDIKKIDIAKHRNGETRGFEVIWLKQFTKFANHEKPKPTDK